MEQIGIAKKEKIFKPEEETFEEEEIEDIQFGAYDDTYKINYLFESDTSKDYKKNLSFGLQIVGNTNLFPFYSIIKIKILNDSSKDKKLYKYVYPRTLLSLEDSSKIPPLRTDLKISQCCKWPSLKISVKCLYFPYQRIPTGLNSKYSLCYLNSVIQMLYNIPKFRQIVFSYPIKDANKKPLPILLALQRIFSQMSINNYKIPLSDKEQFILNEFVPSALELAESFGWTHDDLVEEQDAYEFLTIFLDKLQALFLPFPDLTNQLNMLFNGKFMCNSEIEDFSTFSLPLSKDINFSLNMCLHPNCEENYAKLFFAIDKFIDFASSKESMPREYQIIADALISILNKTNQNSNYSNKYTENPTSSSNERNKNDDNNNNNLNSKSVSFDFDSNECNEITDSIYRILKNDLNNSINQCCLKLATALKGMAKSDLNTQCPTKTAKILSENLSSILQNNQQINNDIAQLICNFYLDEKIKKMSNMTNYFVKLPQVLIFQIRRFNDENGVAKKSNQIFKFPKTLSMKEYLMPQDQDHNDNDDESDYELLSVISHRGELNKGHYVEFSRPTGRGSIWFKFDEKNVSIVSKNEAIDGNFGDNSSVLRSLSLDVQRLPVTPVPHGKIPNSLVNPKPPMFATPVRQTNRREPIIQPLSAYILAYVNKKFINEIVDTEITIPDKLKMTTAETTAPIVVPSSPKTNIIRMIKSDEVSRLIKENHFCMKEKKIIDTCTITIDRKKAKLETVLDLYKSVENKIDGFFLLWRCTHGFNPTKPLTILDQKIDEAITSYFDTFILIQETGNENKIERPFNIFDSLFYLLFFDPFNPDQFKYLGLIEFNIDRSIETIFDAIKEKLSKAKITKRKGFGKGNDNEIAVFYENEIQSAIYLQPSSSIKNAFNSKNSSNLIVQFVYNISNYDKDLSFSDDYSLCNSFSHSDGKSYTEFLMKASTFKYPFNPLFVDYYYRMKYDSFDVKFHRISTNDHITLKVPKKASIGELSRVLFGAFYEKEMKRSKDSALLKMQPISSHTNEVTLLIQSKNGSNDNDDSSQIIVNQQNVLVQLFYSCQRVLYPVTMPIQADSHSLFRGIVPQFQQSLDLFFEFFTPTFLDFTQQYKKLQPYVTARIEVSEDAITYKKIYQIVIDNGTTTFSDISRMIGIDTNNLLNGDMTNVENKTVYRIVMISKGKIVKCISNYDEKIRENDCKNYVLRFEKVPDDQMMGANTIKVRVHYGIRINHSEVKLFGVPFYFPLKRGESENEVFQRIKNQYMKFMSPDEKTEFIITNAQLKIMKESGIESLTKNMVDDYNSSWCICILMNGRIQLREIIAMEKANSSKELKIYT